ncbi:MAG: hypothetical protein ACRDSZ_06260 [Pseudonocardiaceae bacterium]
MEPETKGRVVTLCGVQGCCPTAEFTGDSVVLRDDFQGKVTLTRDEWASFLAKAKIGELD